MDVTEAQTEQGAPGKAQLCWVGCSPMTSHVLPWPWLAQGWGWQKLCHGGRAFFDTSGLQQH